MFVLLLTVCTVVKSKGKISQNFVAFSEYLNFTIIARLGWPFYQLFPQSPNCGKLDDCIVFHKESVNDENNVNIASIAVFAHNLMNLKRLLIGWISHVDVYSFSRMIKHRLIRCSPLNNYLNHSCHENIFCLIWHFFMNLTLL